MKFKMERKIETLFLGAIAIILIICVILYFSTSAFEKENLAILLIGLLFVAYLFFSFYLIRNKLDKQLAEKQKHLMLAHAVESISDCIVITDQQKRIIFINEAFKKTYGYSEKELMGKDISIVYYSKHPPNISHYNFLSSSEEKWTGEVVHCKKDGLKFPVRLSSSVIKDEYGNSVAVVTVATDLTEQKAAEEEIKRYIEELQVNKDLLEQNSEELLELNVKLTESEQKLRELNRNKDKLFSIISHDLRSPFTSLIGLSDLLANEFESLTEEEKRYFGENIYNSAKNALNLIDNLLEWSGVQTGKMKFDPKNISITDLTREVITLLLGSAVKKNIEIQNKLPKDLFAFADANMVYSVLQNLISNAIKYTNEFGIVSITNIERDDYIEIWIRDTGVGMNKSDIEKLFNIDTIHPTLGKAKEKGTGLGLILCKELVEINEGKIWVESQPGRGSTFKFSLPKVKKEFVI